MGSSKFCAVFFCAILTVHVAKCSSSAADFDGEYQLGFFPMKSECSECSMFGDDEEFDEELAMDTESNRRILAATRYISYGALRRNSVPCSRRGASYYNCRLGGQANPYSRGCSRITRCRR
ncbi:RALF domain-containing protein [Cephalotus follicularis]|uniref:RALF domain-containing protein n=1 Tax=Cephalotus follicularis TaxID=3775 RepID=A0A1Q3C461_CEPFO|nr:RALF domain-containing protein [Cephalotus follicularis]